MSGLKDILEKLNLDSSNGLYFFDEQWIDQVKFPSRVTRLLVEKIHPTAFFCFDNKPLVLFFENPPEKKELHRKIWNFNESPIVIIVEDGFVEIFNGFKISDQIDGFLDKIGGNEKLDDFRYLELVTGQAWDKYQEKLHYKNRIDYKLLSNIKSARKLILETFSKTDDDKEIKKQHTKITNALLGKIIFIRYLIDRKVRLNFENNQRIWTNDDLCALLENKARVRKFFHYLADPEKGFNGDLFPLTPKEYEAIPPEVYKIIIRLLKSEDISDRQPSLFDMYDFSIIPIEFISNIYEAFIGPENQEKEGAYYTPLFLVDYILSETITKSIENNQSEDCKVLDPACGSGVFLVETLRKLIEQHISKNANKRPTKKKLKDIVGKNIYGIDKDENAIQVAIFSVYLTLLDYMQPPEIESFQFPNLLNTNFFINDFFDTDATFNSALKSIDFSFIIGNPPWKRGNDEEKPLYIQYKSRRKKQEKSNGEPYIEIGNKEIAQAFLLRTKDFSNEKTKCALIVTSKVLYNLQSVNFRKYFLHYYFIDHVFELAAVRKEVFNSMTDKSIAPASVLFFRYAFGKNTSSNIIKHIALKPSRFFFLFKIFTVSRQDIQEVQQDRLKEYDWLWKILVYGSYLDFNFIKRLKDEYPTINEIINKNPKMLIGQGVMIGGGDPNDASDLVGKRFLDTRTDIKRFWINPDNKKTWQDTIVHRVRNKDLYKAPILLITEGVKDDLRSVSAICYQDSVFKSSLTGIKVKGKNKIDILRQFAGILNSSFFSYYNLMTFSSAGIEREQSHDEEKWSVPFIESCEISTIVQKIETLLNRLHGNEILIEPGIEQELSEQVNGLDHCIFDAFKMTYQENCLVDYVNEMVIPIQMKHQGYEHLFGPLKFEDKMLQDYANLFLERFGKRYETINKKMIAEIWYTKQTIGIFFKIINKNDCRNNIIWNDKQNDITGMFQLITKMASEKITEQLFVQKDVRGFETEGFYIFKPNEKRLWHKAIGYLDVDEFANAMHRAGKGNRYE